MIILAIIAALAAAVWSLVVLFANGMSDAPGAGFKGGWSIIAVWCVVVVLFVAAWVG